MTTPEQRAKWRAQYAKHKEARNAYQRAYYHAHVEDERASNHSRYIEHRDERLAQQREYNKTHPREYSHEKYVARRGWYRALHLRLYFNLTAAEYDSMVERQGNLCAICGRSETVKGSGGAINPLSVDHDRACCPTAKSCGKCVRGLLCNKCNTAIGHLTTSNLLTRAMDYLAIHG